MFDEMAFLNYLEDEVQLDPIGSSDMIADAMNWARFNYDTNESPGSIWDRFKRTRVYAKYGGARALSIPYGDLRDLEGAAVALEVLRMRSEHDGLGDQLQITYQESKWDDTSRAFIKTAPHFVAYAECSDTFFWGTSDAEEITEENLPLLRGTLLQMRAKERAAEPAYREQVRARQEAASVAYKAYQDAHPDKEDREWWNEQGSATQYKPPAWPKNDPMRYIYAVSDLFAARSRKMRPQGAAYKVRYPEDIWDLFNQAGPEREVGFGNPREPGK